MFISFLIFRKFSAIISQNKLSVLSFSSGIPIKCVLFCLMVSQKSCRKESFIPFNFLFLSFGWIISSDLFMSSLIIFCLIESAVETPYCIF